MSTLIHNPRHFGFLVGGFLPYLIGLVAVMAVLTGVYLKGRAAGVDTVRAELLPVLKAYQGRVEALDSQIATQNAAVRALQSAGKARQARAEAGIKAARSDAQKAQIEADRLREAILAPVDKSCEAAVAQVRKGLK